LGPPQGVPCKKGPYPPTRDPRDIRGLRNDNIWPLTKIVVITGHRGEGQNIRGVPKYKITRRVDFVDRKDDDGGQAEEGPRIGIKRIGGVGRNSSFDVVDEWRGKLIPGGGIVHEGIVVSHRRNNGSSARSKGGR